MSFLASLGRNATSLLMAIGGLAMTLALALAIRWRGYALAFAQLRDFPEEGSKEPGCAKPR
jgi:hypothetical protein